MNIYPTMKEVAEATPEQICLWQFSLPVPKSDEEDLIMTSIWCKYHRNGQISRNIIRRLGFRQLLKVA